jgi:ASC-1-like (ASCH) protein
MYHMRKLNLILFSDNKLDNILNMTIWNVQLSDPWFDLVKNNIKKYEGRRYYDKYTKMQIGDYICFNHYLDKSIKSFKKKIINIHRYDTFEKALIDLNSKNKLKLALPIIDTIEEGVNIYYKYVSLATQLKDGVVMIELE